MALLPGERVFVRAGITVTLGVASLLPDTVGLQSLLRAADEEMYRAKQDGKNRVFVRRDEGLLYVNTFRRYGGFVG